MWQIQVQVPALPDSDQGVELSDHQATGYSDLSHQKFIWERILRSRMETFNNTDKRLLKFNFVESAFSDKTLHQNVPDQLYVRAEQTSNKTEVKTNKPYVRKPNDAKDKVNYLAVYYHLHIC